MLSVHGASCRASTMSEEQSGFKVTDRRLFNADGTPREVEREEAPAAAAPTPEAPATTTTTADDASALSAPPSAANTTPTASTTTDPAAQTPEAASPATAAGSDDAAAAGAHEELLDDDYAEGDIPGANDPASFVNFLMSIASNAAAALGMMEHPVTGQRGVDLPLGKHWIDVLGMLEEKTRGNLSPQEQQIFTGLLSDLRMQYVQLTRSQQTRRPGGFTASDILGGK
jgi:hypothetical protein